ncbi:hypothetical protein RIF29_20390 [Crotalaria pallida]|uniref:Uncharacterized protein n=1 Tax=Crotalaria pallida TaxID=3830 RepID=A0AAN9I6A4_CROPI
MRAKLDEELKKLDEKKRKYYWRDQKGKIQLKEGYYAINLSESNLSEIPELAPAVVFVTGPPPPPDSLRGVPFMPPMPPLFFTAPDPQLHTKIVNQIDYYFRSCSHLSCNIYYAVPYEPGESLGTSQALRKLKGWLV